MVFCVHVYKYICMIYIITYISTYATTFVLIIKKKIKKSKCIDYSISFIMAFIIHISSLIQYTLHLILQSQTHTGWTGSRDSFGTSLFSEWCQY